MQSDDLLGVDGSSGWREFFFPNGLSRQALRIDPRIRLVRHFRRALLIFIVCLHGHGNGVAGEESRRNTNARDVDREQAQLARAVVILVDGEIRKVEPGRDFLEGDFFRKRNRGRDRLARRESGRNDDAIMRLEGEVAFQRDRRSFDSGFEIGGRGAEFDPLREFFGGDVFSERFVEFEKQAAAVRAVAFGLQTGRAKRLHDTDHDLVPERKAEPGARGGQAGFQDEAPIGTGRQRFGRGDVKNVAAMRRRFPGRGAV
ncbi:MAG TPA: hypothetical protein VK474_05520 [Chthoniobacterales bacterium]|nr:hypothetical protein [Chthoniobacterales bacterium]